MQFNLNISRTVVEMAEWIEHWATNSYVQGSKTWNMEITFLAGIWLNGIWEAYVKGKRVYKEKAAPCGIVIVRPAER